MRFLLLPAVICTLAGLPADGRQDPKKPETVDCLILQDRTELRGDVVEFGGGGRLKVKPAGGDKTVEVGVEELTRLRFSTDDSRPGNPSGEQVRLAGGGAISGKITSFENDIAVLESQAGAVRLRRQDLKGLFLGTPLSPPELRDERKDILLREVEKKGENGEKPTKECIAEYGRLKSIGEKVVFLASIPAEGDAKEKTELREFDRASVKHIYFHRESGATEFPPGLFAKVTLRNGDRWVAVLQGMSRDKIRLFSHLFGTLEVEKSRVHSLSFIQQAQLTAGNILVADQMGIHEYDAQKQEIWSYTAAAQGAASVRKLRNGNVLVADPNTNRVLEIRPSGRTGGEIVWQLDEVQNPWDAVRLDNGNTLVTERYNNRVAEYDSKTRTVVWQQPAQYPMSAQRLENGNTLISTNNAVYEVDKSGLEKWRAVLLRAGTIRPHRAVRLENGNTLITDLQKGQVVEIDTNSVEVWKKSGLSHPVQAVRLEDGNTLILEQGANRVIEVDPANPRLSTDLKLRGLSVPQGLSTY